MTEPPRQDALYPLDEREVLLRAAARVARVGLFVWDEENNRRIYASEEVARIQGFSIEEFLARIVTSQDIAAEMIGDDGTRYLDVIRDSERTHKPYEVEYRATTKQGKIRHLREVGEYIRNESGELRCVGAVIDVTSQKENEFALQFEKEKLRQIFEAAPTPIFEADWSKLRLYAESLRRNGVTDFHSYFKTNPGELLQIPELVDWVDANEAAVKLYGAASKRDLFDFFKTREEVNWQDYIRCIDLFMAGVGENSIEHTDVSTSGDVIHIVKTFKMPPELDQSWSRIFVNVQDVTAFKKLSVDLVLARDQAQAANAAKSSFLATMSHEIRTPLNGIMGMADLLSSTELEGEQKEFCDTIARSGESLLSIINDILDFSKIEAGKLELDNTAFELRETIEAVLDLVSTKSAEKRLELAYLVEPSVPAGVRGDRNRLSQILLNLLNNAIKFTDKGEVVLSVSRIGVTEGATDDDTATPPMARLSFDIRDTGIGIPAERVGRLFKPFSQIDASTSRRFGGTGLGLAISQNLVKLMGGQISVESVVGKGSRFFFVLNLETAEAARDRRSYYAPNRFKGKIVLIVDDNATNRRVLELHVTSWGFTPVIFANGEDAIDFIRSGNAAHLGIVDMNMPRMTGLEFAEAMRQLPAGKVLPMLLFTSLDQFSIQQAKAAKGFYAAAIQKPIKPSVLLEAIVQILEPGVGQHGQQLSAARTPDLDKQMALRCPMRILLADDNRTNQKLGLALLRRCGYEIAIAASGEEAISIVVEDAWGVDLVLMDIEMPGMDGVETTRMIRDEVDTRQPYVIALTANAIAGDRERYLGLGFDDYISKPIRSESLVRALERGFVELQRHRTISYAMPTAMPFRSLYETVGNDDEALRGIAEIFIDEAGEMARALQAAIQAGDIAALKRLCHTIRGNAQDFEDRLLSKLSGDLEERCSRNETGNIAIDVELLIGVLEDLRVRVRSYLVSAT